MEAYIKPRTPRLNGKVELSHRIDAEEFYHPLDGALIDDSNLATCTGPTLRPDSNRSGIRIGPICCLMRTRHDKRMKGLLQITWRDIQVDDHGKIEARDRRRCLSSSNADGRLQVKGCSCATVRVSDPLTPGRPGATC